MTIGGRIWNLSKLYIALSVLAVRLFATHELITAAIVFTFAVQLVLL